MSDYKVDVGKRVKALRIQNGMTQENLAEILDCSVKHISHAERGIAFLSIEKYLFLSDYFHCSLDYLLKGNEHSDISSELPVFIIEILEDGDSKERSLLLAYLNMYQKIRHFSDPVK